MSVSIGNQLYDTVERNNKIYYILSNNVKDIDDKKYNVIHTASVSIINPKAQLVARISPPFHPHKTGEYLLGLINK